MFCFFSKLGFFVAMNFLFSLLFSVSLECNYFVFHFTTLVAHDDIVFFGGCFFFNLTPF